MLSPEEELHLLESLLNRARRAARRGLSDTINVGDVVQLRPGADPHWQTSLILVSKVCADGSVSGQILRPHRSGCREAWYTYRPPELAKVGHMPYPEPEREVRSQVYLPPCPSCHRAERKPVERERGGKAARKAAE